MFFFFKQKTAYEMRISDWSSDVCSSDLGARRPRRLHPRRTGQGRDDLARVRRVPHRLGAQTPLGVLLPADHREGQRRVPRARGAQPTWRLERRRQLAVRLRARRRRQDPPPRRLSPDAGPRWSIEVRRLMAVAATLALLAGACGGGDETTEDEPR